MGLFGNQFTKEGPGVPKNAPKKKGVARYFEVLVRDYFSFWKAGLLTALCCLPMTLSVVMLVLFSDYLGMVLIGAVLFVASAALVGPALAALHGLVVLGLRDEPFFFWHEYKKIWRSNWRQAVPAGILFSVLGGVECMALWMQLTSTQDGQNTVVLLAMVLLGLLLVTLCWLFTLLQMLYLDMPLPAMLKNSLLLTFGYAKRSMPAGFLTLVLMGVLVALFPAITSMLVMAGAPAMLALLADQWLWPTMEQSFHISEQLEEKKGRESRMQAT